MRTRLPWLNVENSSTRDKSPLIRNIDEVISRIPNAISNSPEVSSEASHSDVPRNQRKGPFARARSLAFDDIHVGDAAAPLLDNCEKTFLGYNLS
jgi:hypothetical protein